MHSVPGERGSGARTERPHRAHDATADEARLVIRAEREKEKNARAAAKRPVQFDADHEGEIYRLERRGGRATFVSEPVADEQASARIAHVDWCAFTLKPPEFKTHTWVMREWSAQARNSLISPQRE